MNQEKTLIEKTIKSLTAENDQLKEQLKQDLLDYVYEEEGERV